LGDDTDTTAAVAGGLAGIRDGVSAIPFRWRLNASGQRLVEPMLERLLERRRRDMR
jgi:ADP-ribosylglycohydrolase